MEISIASANQVVPLETHLSEKNEPVSTLKPEQGELLLSIFRGHMVNASGMLLTFREMNSVYSVLNIDKKVPPKQRLREYCFAGTSNFHRLICSPVDLLVSQRTLSKLPGTLEAFIEGMTDTETTYLLSKLIDPTTGELKNPKPGMVFLDAVKTQDLLLFNFFCAAGYGCSAVLEGIQTLGENNGTALGYAADNGNLRMVQFLLEAGDYYQIKVKLLKDRDSYGITPLMYAVWKGQLEIAQTLLAAADTPQCHLELLKCLDRNGCTLFMAAAFSGKVELLQMVLDLEAPDARASLFTERGNKGQIPLMLAPSSEAVRFLLEKGVELNAETRAGFLTMTDNSGERALGLAMQRTWSRPATIQRQKELIETMIEMGFNPLHQNNIGFSALVVGISSNNINAVRALLGCVNPQIRAALLDQRLAHNETPVMLAASLRNNPEILSVLFQAASEERQLSLFLDRNDLDQTSLMLTKTIEHMRLLLAMAERIGRKNEMINALDRNGFSALFYVIRKGQSEIQNESNDRYSQEEIFEQISLLIGEGLSPANCNARGKTALMYAVELGNVNIVRRLLESVNAETRAALLKIKDRRGKTAWMYQKDNLDMLRLFLEMESPEARPEFFLYAVLKGHVNSVRMMLQEAPSPEAKKELLKARDSKGRTLQAVSRKGGPDMFRVLFDAAPSASKREMLLERNAEDLTLLMLAKNLNTMQILLGMAKEADCVTELITAGNFKGMTALVNAIYLKTHPNGSNISEDEYLELLRILLEGGASLSDQLGQGRTAFMHLVAHLKDIYLIYNKLERMHPLVRIALLSAKDSDGHTAFMHAAQSRGNPAMLQVLFNFETPLNKSKLLLSKNNAGLTPLMLAKTAAHLFYLLKMAKGERFHDIINTRDNEGRTALFWAIQRGRMGADEQEIQESLEQIEMLLKAGLNAADQNKEGQTALMYAVKQGNRRIVEKLVKYKPEQ